jgi:hypothetical protein
MDETPLMRKKPRPRGCPISLSAAKQAWREGDWQHGRFQLPPDDMNEFIPLPD